ASMTSISSHAARIVRHSYQVDLALPTAGVLVQAQRSARRTGALAPAGGTWQDGIAVHASSCFDVLPRLARSADRARSRPVRRRVAVRPDRAGGVRGRVPAAEGAL